MDLIQSVPEFSYLSLGDALAQYRNNTKKIDFKQ